MRRPSRKKTSFVPRSLFKVVVGGGTAIPLCATLGVGCCLGPGECESVAAGAFAQDGGEDARDGDAADAHDGHADDARDGAIALDALGVADVGFREASVEDAPLDVALDAVGGG